MNKSKLSVLNISLLGAALSLGAVGTANAAEADVAAPAAPLKSTLAGLELGVHVNSLAFNDPLDTNDKSLHKFNPVLGYLVVHGGYAFKINRVIDIVPELNLGLGLIDHEDKYEPLWSSRTLTTKTSSSSIIKAGVQFRVNSGRVFSTYVGPQLISTKIKITAPTGASETKSYSKFGGMVGMGFTIASRFMIDIRIDAATEIFGLDAGLVYKF